MTIVTVCINKTETIIALQCETYCLPTVCTLSFSLKKELE